MTPTPKKAAHVKMMCGECLDEGGIFIAGIDGHRCGDCGRQAKYWDTQGNEVEGVKPAEKVKNVEAPACPNDNTTDEIADMIANIEM